MKDALGRRSRHLAQSTGKRVTPQPRDLLWFQKLVEHGPLPTSFLLAYGQGSHKSEKRAKERLTDLFNEADTPEKGTYLIRPNQQFRTLKAGYNQLVYDVSKQAEQALERHEIESAAGNINPGPWLHRHMVACVTASIELATLDRSDVSYIPQRTILERANTALCAMTTVQEPSGVWYEKALLPDALFGLQYHTQEGSRFRFFLVEADRGTEPATTKNFHRKSCLRTLLQYRDYIEGDRFREHLKLSSPILVLNVLTSERRRQQLVRLTEEEIGDRCTYQLFQVWEAFGDIFRPPTPNAALLTSDWTRAAPGSFRIDSATR